MTFFDMNRKQRLALLAFVTLLVSAAVTVMLVSGHSDSADVLQSDSIEMALFKAEIDSARIDTVKPNRKRGKKTDSTRTKQPQRNSDERMMRRIPDNE